MSLTTLPSALRTALSRTTTTTTRLFSTTPPLPASVLFALNALSNSRETQHFNKLSHLSRIEHSPPLKLIQTSEVDAYPLPSTPPAVPLIRLPGTVPRSAAKAWDYEALKAGRAILANHARHTTRLRQALKRASHRETRYILLAKRDRDVWQHETRRHLCEMRAAGVWIVLSIGTATGLAMWRFWPVRGTVDLGELGRRLAATARGSVGLPVVGAGGVGSAVVGSTVAGAGAEVAAAPVVAVEPVLVVEPAVASSATATTVAGVKPVKTSRWNSLFWKQQ
ncbi:hypothetical protein LTR54_017094 [Friedmanniomyces endolithicus]|uniref:Uncharacterized protein n=1 Tax=Friedmanniomyces endolithicus TaxID=329885 RepID=A0AAN6FDA3_9PEZI|nr:hypothetical protein LTS00_016464 [Friedmanniomyces endolithicus]KAK0312310.1 hypothetical protein LTR82_013942 [Friedmanniomyces endolithicus]KAK0974459.1 hypothetical protein LTR54_017094 [Friedmanniomyces endolithicus]